MNIKCKYCNLPVEHTDSDKAWSLLKSHVKKEHRDEHAKVIARIEAETGGKPPSLTKSREKREIPFSALSLNDRRKIGLDDSED